MDFKKYFKAYRGMYPLNERIRMSVFDLMWRLYMDPEEFGGLVGVSASTARSWRDGTVQYIHQNNFEKLWPVIRDKFMEFQQQGLYPS